MSTNVAGQWLQKLILALVNYNYYKYMDLYIVYKMYDMHIFSRDSLLHKELLNFPKFGFLLASPPPPPPPLPPPSK
jgi:hypothetical protein